MLRELAGTARDLGRLQEIGAVLLRYGFGDFARRLGIRLPRRPAESADAMPAQIPPGYRVNLSVHASALIGLLGLALAVYLILG